MSDRTQVVVVLAKEPLPGLVKTRLQRQFSAESAARLAAASIHDTVRAVRSSKAPRRVLCWQGDPAGFAEGFEVLRQRAGSLNDRLSGAFTDVDPTGSTRVLLIGMDTPQVTASLLDVEWDGCDALLGLSEDGGFWAIGLRSPDPTAVFDGIEMSTARTGSAQLARLLALGRSVKLLAPLRDVDEPEDAAHLADHFPQLEFSRMHASLTRSNRPELIFDRIFGGGEVCCDSDLADVLLLEKPRWSARADQVDQLVVSRCQGPVLDVGCGPGRMVQALNESGVPALGVDMSSVAVEQTRSRGALAIRARVAERLPAEGRWGTVLLMDGNIGIGGDIAALLRRCRDLLTSGGTIIVEVDPRPDWHQTRWIRLTADAHRFAELAWTRVGAAALRRLAAPLDLLAMEEWTAGDRSFVSLRSAG